ncbi:diguanylate cyclase (GGDEF) domain-containing protein [Klenkia soli]|uniref:Diguanylate cyclase (GGDEF) domain-containing protein n=1 Tax=Klenkia soli TaxID=1052260 RepID=A0A1H0SVZ6_9ACTN|nr:diguanylate cyclase (GGDEF) domain-containing protein [Klenkia soli]
MIGLGYATAVVAVPDASWRPAAGAAVTLVLHVLAVVSCLVAARREPDERVVWWAVATTFAMNLVGSAVAVVESELGDPPFPSAADVWWLAAYPSLAVGILGLYRSRVAARGLSTWLDAATAGLGAAAVAAAAYAVVPQHGNRLGDLGTAVALSYPSADLVLLSLAIGLVSVAGRRADHVVLLMSVVLFTKTVGDLALATTQTTGGTGSGVLAEICFVVATALGTVTADRAGRRDRRVPAAPVLRAALTPVLGTVAGLCVLSATWGDGRATVAEALALGCLAAAVARSALGVRDAERFREIHRLASTDELTGLPNRRAFLAVAETLLDDGRPVGILLLDLDGFKAINDGLGHAAGDDVLLHVAGALSDTVRTGCTPARLGGDEFAVLVPDADLAATRAVAAALEASVTRPVPTSGTSVRVGVSIGAAAAHGAGTGAVDLLRAADLAMYDVKRSHHGTGAEAPVLPSGAG